MGKNMADVLLKITTIAFLKHYSLIPYQYEDTQKEGSAAFPSGEISFIPK